MSAGAEGGARELRGARPPLADALALGAVALVLRIGVVAWAWSRIGPAADGTFYDTIARRIADGLGYTWRWPDGTVTYAAHYPVGYPALVAFGYRFFERAPGVAMLLGAVLGSAAVLAVHRVLSRAATRRQAFVGALLLAVHPGLLSYTPALMTEGVTASLVAISLYAFVRARERDGRGRIIGAALLGIVVALATYVRPQCIVLAPLLGLFMTMGGADHGASPRATAPGWRRAAGALLPAAIASVVALAVIAPWTARNCDRMGRCALVSVNGGWNLLIGTDPDAHGSWAEVKVPAPCRTVFDEAEKDACFGREAQRQILAHPVEWLALVPAKLAATFDYAGAGPWYLHASNPNAFPYGTKVFVAAVELLFERVVLLAAGVGVIRRLWRTSTSGRRAAGIVAASALSLVTVHAYFAVLGLLVGLALLVFRAERPADEPDLQPIFGSALVVLGSTAVIHAVFFGAGRYSLVVFPVLVILAALASRWGNRAPVIGSFDRGAAPRAS